jgi:amicyanin
LGDVLGITHVNYVAGSHTLAVVDSSLGMVAAQQTSFRDVPAEGMVNIDNFSFSPKSLTVKAGATVTWMNHDDIPHNVVSTERKFSSPVLDTDQNFSFSFQEPGSYPYYCKIHPTMTGTIVVEKEVPARA